MWKFRWTHELKKGQGRPKQLLLFGSYVLSGIIWNGIKGSFTCVQRPIQCEEPFMCLEQHGAVCRQPVLINGDDNSCIGSPAHLRTTLQPWTYTVCQTQMCRWVHTTAKSPLTQTACRHINKRLFMLYEPLHPYEWALNKIFCKYLGPHLHLWARLTCAQL